MKMVKVTIVKSAAKSLLIFSPLILGMILTNYFVDPGALFRGKGYEEGIARILAQGLNVANISDCDERLLQMYYIKNDREAKDTIILGSSRIMQLNANNLSSGKFFNHGVSGASLEDFFSICELYEQKNKLPGTIILGLDPWLLNKNNCQERWQSISIYNYAFMNRLRHKANTHFFLYDYLTFQMRRSLNLISPSYFKQAIRSFVRRISKLMKFEKIREDYYATGLDNFDADKRLDVDVRIADGTISYGKRYILKSSESVKAYVSSIPVYSLGEFYELDKANQQNFEKFIEYLIKKNVKVVFFLPPYHPYVYSYLMNSTQYRIVGDAETYFRTIGNQKHIMVIGSYDPRQCGLVEEDFYDGMHLSREAIVKLSQFLKPVKTNGAH